jgi:nucleoside-diphosphate-sugar epimerase
VYGASDDEIYEDARPAPFNDYGLSKLEAEEVHKKWAVEQGDRALTIVRPTVVFGEGNRGNVFTLIDQIARRRFAVVGDGKNMKSLAYVENVAAFLEHVLHDNCGTTIFNYVDKPDYTTGDLVRTIRQQLGRVGDGPHIPYTLAMALGACCDAFVAVSGRRLPFSRIRVRKFCTSSCFSNARAMASGFAPAYALPDGLQRTIRYELGGHV